MKPVRLLSLAVLLLCLLAPRMARADETAERQATKPSAGHADRAVVLGADGGLAAFIGGARSRLGAEPGTLLHLHGGYRFSGGIEPELSFSYIDFSRVPDSRPRIVSLAPGCRWWIPLNGPIQPWIGAHLGMDVVQAESGDVSSEQKYWSIDAGGGIDFMVTRHVGLGTSVGWAYANILNRLKDQPPVPGEYGGPAERPASAMSWLTMRAGLAVFL